MKITRHYNNEKKIYIKKIFRKMHLKNSLQVIPTLFDKL